MSTAFQTAMPPTMYVTQFYRVWLYLSFVKQKKTTIFIMNHSNEKYQKCSFICHTFIFNNILIFIIPFPSMIFISLNAPTTRQNKHRDTTLNQKKKNCHSDLKRKKITFGDKNLPCAAIVVNNCWISTCCRVFVERMFHFMAVIVDNEPQLIYLST